MKVNHDGNMKPDHMHTGERKRLWNSQGENVQKAKPRGERQNKDKLHVRCKTARKRDVCDSAMQFNVSEGLCGSKHS